MIATMDKIATDKHEALRWLAENWERVTGLAKSQCRGRYDLVDDLMGEATDRVAAIAANYEPCLGSRDQHFMGNLRWYFFKWMNKNAARLAKTCALDAADAGGELPHVAPCIPDLDGHDIVQDVMGKLDEYHRTILLLYYAHDKTFEEIGRMTGVSKGTARLHCHEAMAMAREIISNGQSS